MTLLLASCGAATVVPVRPAQPALHSVSTDTVGVPQRELQAVRPYRARGTGGDGVSSLVPRLAHLLGDRKPFVGIGAGTGAPGYERSSAPAAPPATLLCVPVFPPVPHLLRGAGGAASPDRLVDPTRNGGAPTHPSSATPTSPLTPPSPGGTDASSASNSPAGIQHFCLLLTCCIQALAVRMKNADTIVPRLTTQMDSVCASRGSRSRPNMHNAMNVDSAKNAIGPPWPAGHRRCCPRRPSSSGGHIFNPVSPRTTRSADVAASPRGKPGEVRRHPAWRAGAPRLTGAG